MARLSLIVAALIFALALRADDLRAQTPVELAPRDGVLLLTNGQVIAGQITRAGDLFLVTLPEGEIRVRSVEVEHWCATVDEGYQRKHATVRAGNIEDILELTQWCLRHRLYGYAARELAAAYELEPKHPQIRDLDRRLAAALEKPAVDKDRIATAASGPTNEQLDAMARELPDGALTTFTRTIQPLVQNYCATAGCHNVGNPTTFTIARIPSGRPLTQRSTQRNLYTILQHLTKDDLARSPLLTKPLGPHGGLERAVFLPRDAMQYQELVNWVDRFAPRRLAPTASETPTATPVVKQAELPAATNAPASVLSQRMPPSKPTAPAPRATAPAEYQPVDPFDAEAFNRRHFADDADG